jgi:NitT/TauT family transport system ATP-binding protein
MTAAQPAAKAEAESDRASFDAASIGTELAFRCRDLAIDVGVERRRIVAGLDLEVPRRQVVCMLGESGVGKTTLLRVFGGLAPAAPGSTLELKGQPIVGPPDSAVFVFQN